MQLEFSSEMTAAIEEMVGREIAQVIGRGEVESIADIEGGLRQWLQQVGQRCLQSGLRQSQERYPSQERPCPYCTGQAEYERRRPAKSLTVFGWVEYRRAYYLCGACHRGHCAFDQELGLEPGGVSAGLGPLLALLGIQNSFAEARDKLAQELLLIDVCDNTVRQQTQQMGQLQAVVESELQQAADRLNLHQERAQASGQQPKRLYGSLDGTIVPIGKEWRELKAICWYNVQGKAPPPGKERVGEQAALQAHSISYYCDIESATNLAPLLWASGVQHAAHLADELVFVADGAAWIWKLVEAIFPKATQIVDWYHAAQYLPPIARTALADAADQARWLADRRQQLWNGEIDALIAACEALETHPTAGEAAAAAATYFFNNQARMDYARFRAAGYQIGSGTMESGCKQIASLRLKRPGARWSEAGARYTAKARAAGLEALADWHVADFLASGGRLTWFAGLVRAVARQHLNRLGGRQRKWRFPIPGGRYYLFPAEVGGRDVGPGQVALDPATATAWVNDRDWLDYIVTVLGGGDGDDAVWVVPFTDLADRERKVLVWRSPNQPGEYVLLRPAAGAHTLQWAVPGGSLAYPALDSRRLPPRVDYTDPAYLGPVDTGSAGGLGEGEAYSVEVMEAAIDRAVANQGALGMYCNSLMLNKALYGRLPAHPPAPLEDIIDGAVKTGADLSQVVAWNYANSREILESRIPIPPILHQRLSIDWADRDNRPPLPRASGMAGRDAHWLDRLDAGVKAHIEEVGRRRDGLAGQARPPQALFDHALADPEAIRLGAGLNQAYAAALRTGRKGEFTNALERAKYAAEDYLAHFPPERRRAILRGALASVYGAEALAADTAVWLAGAKGEPDSTQLGIGSSSVASLTIEALREIGLLDDLIQTKAGLISYPAELRGPHYQ